MDAWCKSASDLYDLLEEFAEDHYWLIRYPEIFAKQVTAMTFQEVLERELSDDSEIER